jgi:type II secretory pathway pseudopilin PulG
MGAVVVWIWLGLAALVMVVAVRAVVRWRRNRLAGRLLDGALRHLQGGAPPAFPATDADAAYAACARAADGFFGLGTDVPDPALLARFAAAEAEGIAPEALLEELWERCGATGDPVARRAVVLCTTRPDQTHRVPRTGWDAALRLAGDDAGLLTFYAERMRACMAANAYLYLDMPDGADLRAAALRCPAVAPALERLAQEHDAALAQALQD